MDVLVAITLSLTSSGPRTVLHVVATRTDETEPGQGVQVCDPPASTPEVPVVGIDLSALFEGTGLVETSLAAGDQQGLVALAGQLISVGVPAALAARGLNAAESFDPHQTARHLVDLHVDGYRS